MSEASELLERARELTVNQSSLIEILLDKCKSLMNDNAILQGTIKATVAERDEARARLTKQNESMKNLDRVGMEATIAMRDDIVRLGRERDEARACFSAEKSANEELHKRLSEMVPLSELAAMTRKAEDAEAAGWRMRQELDNTADENAKAAREIEVLKARKVKLPHPRIGWDKSRTAKTVVDWQQTIAAIRAAGVEVES